MSAPPPAPEQRTGVTVARFFLVLALAILEADRPGGETNGDEWLDNVVDVAARLAEKDGIIGPLEKTAPWTMRDLFSTIAAAAGAVRAILTG